MTNLANKAASIQRIREFPAKLEALVHGLTPEQLTTAYNAPEWTIAQNVHHVADSHMNSYIRFKLTLLEDNPPLKGYNQADWAETVDANNPDLEPSLTLLRGLHTRWVQFLESIPDDAFQRTGMHSENGPITLAWMLENYAQHGDGHLVQIQAVLDKMPK